MQIKTIPGYGVSLSPKISENRKVQRMLCWCSSERTALSSIARGRQSGKTPMEESLEILSKITHAFTL